MNETAELLKIAEELAFWVRCCNCGNAMSEMSRAKALADLSRWKTDWHLEPKA